MPSAESPALWSCTGAAGLEPKMDARQDETKGGRVNVDSPRRPEPAARPIDP